MHITEIRALNWICYRGEHALQLTPTVYGVTAKYADDEGRSNWGGKTSLLNLIRFALFGKRPSVTEDGWITRGESEGGCGLQLSDGTLIERRRQRGKATRLAVVLPDGRKAFDADGQTALEEHIGLTDDDFIATCFFKQKEISKFVTAKPADRMAIIAGWLQLEPLQRAEKRVRTALSALLDKEDKLVTEEKVHKEAIGRYLSKYFDDVDTNTPRAEVEVELQEIIGQARAIADATHEAAKDLKVQSDRLLEWKRQSADAKKYYTLCDEAAALGDVKAHSEALSHSQSEIAGIRRKLDVVAGECRVATDKQLQASKLACGEFDGRCPVDGHQCPDRPKMNAARVANRKLAESANFALTAAKKEHAGIKQDFDSQLLEQAKTQRTLREIESLLAQAGKLKPAADTIATKGEPPTDSDIEAKSIAEWNNYQALEAEAREAVRIFDSVNAEYDAIDRCISHRCSLKEQIATHQQASVILGKTGAQRRIAEGALQEITSMANASLQDAMIPLTVDVQWWREGSGLADECSVCGATFGKGRGVKECARCGAARGAKTIERIEVVLSDVSGAAEDIAGLCIQLAAGAWLRARRNTAWGVCCIDEPFGALDTTLSNSLATHVATLLRSRFAVEQTFVVAHSRGVNDAMPGRIGIVVEGNGSRMEVL
jgi:DNA repair exonuclease SbcCD ATPase subunit